MPISSAASCKASLRATSVAYQSREIAPISDSTSRIAPGSASFFFRMDLKAASSVISSYSSGSLTSLISLPVSRFLIFMSY